MTPRQLLKYLLTLSVALPLYVEAEVDVVQSKMVKPYVVPLRWDNVERTPEWFTAPEWLSGERPVLKKGSKLHVVRLAPNKWVEVRVKASEMLRILGVEQPLDAQNLRVLVSNGTGLYVEPILQKTADNKNWLANADAATVSVYRIENISINTEPLEIALFTSRHDYLGDLAPYRELINLPTQEVALLQSFDAVAQRYWKLNVGQDVTLKVTGPRRLTLANRLHYPTLESSLIQSWRISAWLDGQPLHTAEVESNIESLQEISVDNVKVVTSREEQIYLDIPVGEYQLRLQSSAPLYARLLQQDSTDYLFPKLNQPRISHETARKSLDPNKAKQTSWQRMMSELQSATSPLTNSNEVESSAQRLAMDNRWSEGGLAGGALLHQDALAHPEDHPLKRLAAHFTGTHTLFRDILPKYKDERADMLYRYFRIPHLSSLGRENQNPVIAPQHKQDLLDQLGAGYFITLPEKSGISPAVEAPVQRNQVVEKVREVVLFDNDSSRILPQEQAKLDLLAKRWHQSNNGLLEIQGHTDSNASSEYNQKLSMRRADGVLRALTALGVRAIINNVQGYGLSSPAATNTTRAGRQQNRRVEITFQKPIEKNITAPVKQPADVALYQLPEAFAPRLLRIAAYGDQDAEFFVQIDNQPIRRLRLSPSGRLPLSAFSPSNGEGGLLLQQLEDDARNDGTLSASFSRTRVAAPMVAAGVAVMTLPSSGREVRLWRATQSVDGLHVAVQYQASSPPLLSEREFLTLHDLDQDKGLPLREAIRKHSYEDINVNNELLASQWRPLIRLLGSEYRQAKVSVHPQTAPPLKSINSASAAKQARSAEVQGQWLLALEHWSNVWFSTAPKALREEAEWGRINALQHLGEDFMFEQMLKQILLFDADPTRQIHALNLLEKQYQSTKDDDALLRLYAIAVHQFDDPIYWQKAVQSLINAGEFRLAILAGLAMQPEQRPTEQLLQAAWRLYWWQTFDHLLLGLKNEEQKEYWLGMRYAAHSQFNEAMNHFRESSTGNQTYAKHVADGLVLRNTLENEQSTNEETYKNWRKWQVETPGPRVWRDASEIVKDFSGALPGYTIDRDLNFSLYKATAEHPLQLKVTGPTKIRLDVRPIHASQSGSTLEGWVTARSDQGLWTAPITANQPTEGLVMAGGVITGKKIPLEIPVAAGEHTINVSAGNLPIAVRVYIEQALMPLGVLPTPPLSDVNEPHAEHITFEPALPEKDWWHYCKTCIAIPNVDQDKNSKYYRIANAEPHDALVLKAPENSVLNTSEVVDREAQLLANNNYDALLDSIPLGADGSDLVLKRMTLLLRIAETSPKHYERVLAAGMALASANNTVDGLSRLLGRLTRKSGWNAQETVQESAGVRLLPVNGWQPESPSSRIQKALLPPLAENEQVISGNARMVLSLLNTSKEQVEFEFQAEDLGGLPPQPLQVSVQRDGEATRTITLMPNTGWKTQSISLPAGRHALRFSMQNPIANQLVRIRLKERRNQPITSQIERTYQVATAKQPVRATLAGPTWLRVDEWRDNQTQSRYQYLDKPWQTVTLSPATGQKEALFRLHLRTVAPEQPQVLPRYIGADVAPVPEVPVKIGDPDIPSTAKLVDEFKLGKQDDGTWTAAVESHSRYDIDTNFKENFLEGSLTYRYFDEPGNMYYTAQALTRLHQNGDPVIGGKFRVNHTPWNSPINLFAEINAFSQTVPLVGNHWSTNLKVGISERRDINPKTWHTPSFTAFAYKLGASDSITSTNVDQDIYTIHKSQHRFGYDIGDSLTYRPYLDTLLMASIGISSNENLVTPDKFGLNLKWKQLLGNAQVDVHLNENHYFSDSNRKNSTNNGVLGIGLTWDYWTSKQDRLEFIFNLNRSLPQGDTSGWLGLRWHFDNGRRYRDFRPSEIDFRDLLERNIPDTPNNRIEAVTP